MSHILSGIIIALVLGWLARQSGKEAEFRQGRKVLEYRRGAKISGWIFVLIGILIFAAATQASKDQRVIAALVGSALFLAGIGLFLEFHFVRVEFDDESIFTFSPWKEKRIIPWSSITGYSYSEMNRWHILKSDRHGLIRISSLLSGQPTLIEELRERGFTG